MSDSSRDGAARQHPRYRMDAEVRVTRDGELVAERALDVSAGGVRVRALAELAVGDTVRVALRLPGSGVWVEGEGVIARRIEGRRARDDGRSYGIRLRAMSRVSQQVLGAAACWYDEPERGREKDPDAAARRTR